jgi:predicted permease
MDLHKQALSRLEAFPGARSATMAIATPLTGGVLLSRVSVTGYTPAPDENLNCNALVVGPRFFETMKMPLLAGRDFGPREDRPALSGQDDAASSNPPDTAADDRPPSVLSAVVNQSMARHFFGNENPIGKFFNWDDGGRRIEIIGVVKDAKFTNLREKPPRTFYLYYFQAPIPLNLTIQLRTDGDPASYAATIQRVVREIDPQLQVVELQTMSEAVNETLVQERFVAQLGGAFSLFALLLACVGLYGVMSCAVVRRTNEIGIRMALGAQARDVLSAVIGQGMRLTLAGIAIGLAAAWALTRFLTSLLYGVSARDPITFVVVPLALVAVAWLACYVPARRATKVDPLVALRCE